MDSPACALSERLVLVKNLERFPCRLTNGIIALNTYQTLFPLTVTTSSVSLEHVGSLPSDCNVLLDSSSFFFRSFFRSLFANESWLVLRSFCFQLQNLALVKMRIAFHCFPKSLCPFILFLFWDCGVSFFIQLHEI